MHHQQGCTLEPPLIWSTLWSAATQKSPSWPLIHGEIKFRCLSPARRGTVITALRAERSGGPVSWVYTLERNLQETICNGVDSSSSVVSSFCVNYYGGVPCTETSAVSFLDGIFCHHRQYSNGINAALTLYNLVMKVHFAT